MSPYSHKLKEKSYIAKVYVEQKEKKRSVDLKWWDFVAGMGDKLITISTTTGTSSISI